MNTYTSTRNTYWQPDLEPAETATYRGTLRHSPTGRTWKGFGGCFNEIGWDALQQVSETERTELLDLFFDPHADGCRFQYNRLPIGASDFGLSWYSLNENPGDFSMEHFSIDRDRACLIPYIRESLTRCPDSRLFASPWSPPTWMKFPCAHNFGNLIQTEENLRAYALYFSTFLKAYREEGVDIQALHVQNEPAVSQKFPSCKYTGAELCRLIADVVAPHFREVGEQAEVWLGTINSPDYDEYLARTLDHPDGRDAVAGVGLQWNGKHALPQLRSAHPDLPVIQTENECGDGQNTWDYAQYVFTLARHYIHYGVEAYVYWNFVLYEGGDSTWGWKQNSLATVNRETGELTLTPEYYVMKHLSRFVPAGSEPLEVTGTWAAHAIAFRNPAGQTVTLLHNPHPEAARVDMETGSVTFPPESICTVVE